MAAETALVAVLFCVALVPLLAAWYRVHVRYRWALAGLTLLWASLPVVLILAAVEYPEPVVKAPPVPYRPVEVEANGYVGSKTCRSCHPHEHATWHASYHRRMTQLASPETVLGDFNNVELREGHVSFRLFRRGDEFWVDMDVPPSEDYRGPMPRVKRPIVMTTGSHHYQVYWFKIGDDTRLVGMLPFVWHREAQRWMPRNSVFLKPAEREPLNEIGRWNEVCLRCHATFGRMRPLQYDEQRGFNLLALDTQVAEFGIACESCHGPGQRHVQANRDPARRYRLHLSEAGDPTIVNPRRLPHDRATEVCGHCHGIYEAHSDEMYRRWSLEGDPYVPGDELAKSPVWYLVRYDLNPRPKTLEERLQDYPEYLDSMFWSDGVVRVAGREYNGMVITPCYQRGEMSCLSCHVLHQPADDPRPIDEWRNDQLKAEALGNRACTQCHSEFADAQALAAHTHHQPASSGSLCYNCHMPHTTYGLLKAIRSHVINSPSVAVSVETGRPNACNLCHLDKTLAWTDEHLQDWYGMPPAQLTDEQRSIAASILWLLRGDAAQRALMAWSFGWQDAREVSGTDWMAPYLGQLLEDPYDAVRFRAYQSLRTLPGFADVQYDFLGEPQHWMQAKQQVRERWSRASGRREAAHLLLDPRGQLLEKTFNRLLMQRDERKIYILE